MSFSGGVNVGVVCVGSPLGALVDVAVIPPLVAVDVALAFSANDGPTAT